jgi:hypothetical protein
VAKAHQGRGAADCGEHRQAAGNPQPLTVNIATEPVDNIWPLDPPNQIECGPPPPTSETARVIHTNTVAAAGIGPDMLDSTLGCLMALLGLITIGGGAWGLFKIFQEIRLLFLLDEG